MNQQTSSQVQPKKLLFALLVPLFMALVAVSVVNVAVTPMTRSLGATSSQIQWVVSGYALAFGVFLVAAGRLGDVTGRRRVFLWGISLFVLGATLCSVAPTADMLIAARVLQGFGSGLLNPQTTGIIQRHFTGQARARAYGLFGTTVALATMVGPVIGGLLIQIFGDSLGWRMMFLFNLPLGLVAIVAALKWIPNDKVAPQLTADGHKKHSDLDPVGTALMAVSIFAIMWPFVERSGGLSSWLVFAVGLAVFGGFVLWERHYKKVGRPPMLDLNLFAEPAFRNGILIVGTYFLGNTSVWFIVPVYMQTHLGESALLAACIGIPASLLSAFVSPWAGKHVLGWGRRLIMAGFLTNMTAMLGSVLMIWPIEAGHLPAWTLGIPLALVGVAGGMTISPNQTLTLKAVPVEISGVAGGVLSLGQRIGTAIGTALIPGIMFSVADSGAGWNLAFTLAFGSIFVLMIFGLIFTIIDRRREVAEERSSADSRV